MINRLYGGWRVRKFFSVNGYSRGDFSLSNRHAAITRSHRDDGILESWRGGYNPIEFSLLQTKSRRWFIGHDGRGSRLVGEERQLTKRVTGLQDIHDFVSVAFLDDSRTAAPQEIEIGSRLAFANDCLVYGVIPDVHRSEQIADLLRRKRRKHCAEFEEVADRDIGNVFVEVLAQVRMFADQL